MHLLRFNVISTYPKIIIFIIIIFLILFKIFRPVCANRNRGMLLINRSAFTAGSPEINLFVINDKIVQTTKSNAVNINV